MVDSAGSGRLPARGLAWAVVDEYGTERAARGDEGDMFVCWKLGIAPTGLVTALPCCKLRGRTAGAGAGAGAAAAGASRSGEGVEKLEEEEGADCCGLEFKVKAASRASPVGCASSATSAMLGMGGRTGAECETGDDGT
jgi:hypothetical protein